MFKNTNANICWCPYVDAFVMGPSRVNDLIARGVNVILGSDGGAWGNMDLFEQARYGRVGSKMLSNALYHDKIGLNSADTLRMLTSSGGKALGEPIGILEKGYKADILMLDPDCNMVPANNLEYSLVNMASSRNLNTVIIDGKIVMENKEVLTIDENRVLQASQDLITELADKIDELKDSLLTEGKSKC